MEKKNLLVLFPGRCYTVTCPLLYYAYMKYERKGYECVAINYHGSRNIDDVKNIVKTQIEEIKCSNYGDVIFLSKSMGTVLAGWIDETLCIGARHVYLTPIKNTLPYLRKEKNITIVIAGTHDDFLDADTLTQHCGKEGIRLELIDNADHSLEIPDGIGANIDILKRVVDLY